MQDCTSEQVPTLVSVDEFIGMYWRFAEMG